MPAGRLFDAYLMVDWSAAARPRLGRDSIWLALQSADGETCLVENLATRAAAGERLRALLLGLRRAGKRVLVGFDFPFGYPAGTARRVTGADGWRPLWAWLAARLEDGQDNANNRYLLAEAINREAFDGAGPFWGHPHQRRYSHLPPRKPDGYGTRYPAERRLVERHIRSAQVVWKLVGNGQVGGQVLTGLPAVLRLRDDPDLGDESAIWPFEAGGDAATLPPILLAEIYPSLEAVPDGLEVKDARQVRAVVAALSRADAEGRLAGLLQAPWDLPEDERRAVVEEEAWMLNLQPRPGPGAPGAPAGSLVTSPWLSVVGLGEDGLDGLAPAARALVEAAEVLVGGDRHLALLGPKDGRERLAWPRPLLDLLPALEARRGRPVCVLATGDPLCYGVGTTLLRRFAPEECLILPAPSAFSLACARLGWPLDRVETLTLHGRPLELILARLYPGARILALSEGAATPGQVAELLVGHGLGEARLVVLEHMGGARERRLEATAGSWADSYEDPAVAAFNTLAVEIPADAAMIAPTRLAGLPDAAFLGDGQMTKREVRAATLAALAPWPGALLWDVGAGCGSVAIEWLRSDPRCRAVAVEHKPRRVGLIAGNAAALGVPSLRLVEGRAPAALEGLDLEGRERPDAVFIGGGLDTEGLFEACWAALKPGGRLVANVVTLEGEARLLALRGAHGGELSRIQVARAEPVGPFHGWRPLMPVTQWVATKPREAAR